MDYFTVRMSECMGQLLNKKLNLVQQGEPRPANKHPEFGKKIIVNRADTYKITIENYDITTNVYMDILLTMRLSETLKVSLQKHSRIIK